MKKRCKCIYLSHFICILSFHELHLIFIPGVSQLISGHRFSTMINAALQSWSYDAEVYAPEIARTTFLKALLLQELGKTLKANVAFNVAKRLRAKIAPKDKRDVRTLTVQDFDELVIHWSK